MPDNAVALSINPPNPIGGMDTIAKFAQIQNALNQNRLFQQTFAARQQAGQIIASAPDLETGLGNLFKDPLTAAFAGPIVNDVRQSQNTMADIATKELARNQSAGAFIIHGLASAVNNPSALEDLVNAGLTTVPQQDKARVGSYISSIVKSLGDGLPKDTSTPEGQAQWMQGYNKNLTGLLLSAGHTPESLRALTGTMSPAVTWQPGPGGEMRPVVGGSSISGTPANVPLQIGGAATGTAVNALGATTPPSAATSSLYGPSTQQQAYFHERGTNMANYQKALDERVNVGSGIMQTVSEAQDALSRVRTGGGASAYSRLAQIAQAFGASNDVVDKISGGSADAAQEFAKLMVNTTMGQIREQLQGIGQSRLSQMEFKTFSDNNPNLDTDPRAVKKIFDFWTRVHNRDFTEQQRLGEYAALPGANLSNWPAMWQKIMRDEGMVRVGTPAAGSQASPGGAPTYGSAADVAAAYRAGTLSRDNAAKILRDNKWAQ